MGHLNQLVRQRRTLTAALAAAVGSFVLGIVLPVNLRANQVLGGLKVQVSRQGTPVQVKLEVPKLKDAIEQRVEVSQQALARLEDRFNFSVPGRFQGTTVTQAKLKSDEKAIALTFDDGPWPTSTEQILEVLKQNNIKATFFWVGRYLQTYPEIGKKVATAGHAIGNHTWNHQYFKYNQETASREIDRTSALIEKLTGIKTSMFRPPAGILNNGLVDYAQKQKYVAVMWSVDSMDWRTSTPSLLENVLNQASAGGIVLMHDGGGNRSKTVEALPKMIAELRKRGYKFVTVPELLAMQDREMVAQEKGEETAAK
ncbi:MAG: polysaccharide deacetylase family protein [Actinomycetota bacterium]